MQEMKRGVLVDGDGYFAGAYQWPSGTFPPNFNPPRSRARRRDTARELHLLTSDAAIAGADENGRWNFALQVWEYPTTAIYLVDERGQLRGSKKIWPERYVVPFGMTAVTDAPPAADTFRPIWNAAAATWQPPRKVFFGGASGLCELVALENPRDDVENAPTPPGRVRLGDDSNGHPVDVVHGRMVGAGCLRQTDGRWRDIRRDKARKSTFAQVLAARQLTSEFATYLNTNGLERAWSEIASGDDVQILSPYVFRFLEAEGMTADAIADIVADATGTPMPA